MMQTKIATSISMLRFPRINLLTQVAHQNAAIMLKITSIFLSTLETQPSQFRRADLEYQTVSRNRTKSMDIQTK